MRRWYTVNDVEQNWRAGERRSRRQGRPLLVERCVMREADDMILSMADISFAATRRLRSASWPFYES